MREHPASVNAFGRDDWGVGAHFLQRLSDLRKGTRVAGPELFAAIENVERDLRSAAHRIPTGTAVHDETRRRYLVKRATATEADLHLLLAELERTIEAERVGLLMRERTVPGIQLR